MRVGLIGASALGGEHYYNLIEALINGRIDRIVTCDTNPALRPVETPEFAAFDRIPASNPRFPGLDGRVRRIQMFHSIHRNRVGEFPNFYEDYASMLENEQLDAVIVGTPNFTHAEIATATLSRKIPTLCEKPLAPTMKEVDRILDAAKENDTLLQVGLAMRWRRLMRFVRDKLREGAIGDVRMAWGREFRGDWKRDPATLGITDAPAGNWRYSQRHSGGSFLEKLCHDLDAMYWFIGAEPVKATAYGGIGFFPDGRDTIDHAAFLVEFANGVRLNFDYCMAAPYAGRFKGRWYGFTGTGGMLDLDERADLVTIYNTPNPRSVARFENIDPPTLPGHHRGNNTVIAFRDFLDRIEQGTTVALYDPAENRVTTKLCLGLEESVKRGGETIDLTTFEPE